MFSTPSWALQPSTWYNTGTRWVRVPSRAPACGWPWDMKRDSKEIEKSTKKKQQCSDSARHAGNGAAPEMGYNLPCPLAVGRSLVITSAPFLISMMPGHSLSCREITGPPCCSSFSPCKPGRTAVACWAWLARRALHGSWSERCLLPPQLHSLTQGGAKEPGTHFHD